MRKIVGNGDFTYEMCQDWAQLPHDWQMPAAAVAVDSLDKVFVFNRTQDHPIVVFDKEGNFLNSWAGGEDLFKFHHAVTIDRDDDVWLIERDYCTVMKFTAEGQHLLTIGEKGYRSDTGIPNDDFCSDSWLRLQRSAGPFNLPTDIAIATNGDLFISDGYANARIHKFTADGRYQKSWGEPGSAPGQLNLPHGVWVDSRDRVLVADRENNRIQAFTQDGEYLTEWHTGMVGPAIMCVDRNDIMYVAEHNGGNVSIMTLDGELLARWGSTEYTSMHGISVDSHGDIYVAQPSDAGGGLSGRTIVKYVKQS